MVQADSEWADATSLADFSGAVVLGQKDTLLDGSSTDPGVEHATPVDSIRRDRGLKNGTCAPCSTASRALAGRQPRPHPSSSPGRGLLAERAVQHRLARVRTSCSPGSTGHRRHLRGGAHGDVERRGGSAGVSSHSTLNLPVPVSPVGCGHRAGAKGVARRTLIADTWSGRSPNVQKQPKRPLVTPLTPLRATLELQEHPQSERTNIPRRPAVGRESQRGRLASFSGRPVRVPRHLCVRAVRPLAPPCNNKLSFLPAGSPADGRDGPLRRVARACGATPSSALEQLRQHVGQEPGSGARLAHRQLQWPGQSSCSSSWTA